ncbi:MAG: nitroreductase family protein [Clostridia bacterium]|nr:nitroreductase family protein [Clostridia bacterium]
MNEVLKQLNDRKSVRVFTDAPISAEDKQAILTAAVMAPTAGNQQLYTIIDVTDPQKKEQLAESCDHQPFIAQAKLVLVFCADCLKWYDAFCHSDCAPRRPGVGDLLLAVDDALIAAQNAVTAAESLGIGSCYIGDIMENRDTQKEILGFPEYVFPAAMLVFGYPTEQQRQRQKPKRVDLSYIVHENTYRHMDAAELRRMLSKNCRDGDYDRWIQAFCDRKYNSDFAREMTASVAAYLDEFQKEGEQ